MAARLEQAKSALAEDDSEVRAATCLQVPRNTPRYWRSRQNGLKSSEQVAECFASPDGVAFLHQVVIVASIYMRPWSGLGYLSLWRVRMEPCRGSGAP